MTEVKMPEPVAHRWAAPITGEGGVVVGRRQWEYSATQKGLPWWDRDGLITTDQAEAYAAAKVREALEEAAQVCGTSFKNLDEQSTTVYQEGALHAADILEQKIRELIK